MRFGRISADNEPSDDDLGERLGHRVFGGSWTGVSRATGWFLRVGCALGGAYLAGHYLPDVLAGVAPESTITTAKVLIAAFLGGVVGYWTPRVVGMPLILLGGGVVLVVWFLVR